jgi:hypothetical protein
MANLASTLKSHNLAQRRADRINIALAVLAIIVLLLLVVDLAMLKPTVVAATLQAPTMAPMDNDPY